MYNKYIEIGDILIYNGELKYAQNEFTKDLMEKYLSVGEHYIVKDILFAEEGYLYYKINDSGGYWYDTRCFELPNSREHMIRKYNLR